MHHRHFIAVRELVAFNTLAPYFMRQHIAVDDLKAALLEEAACRVADVGGEALRATGRGQLFQRVGQQLADPVPGRCRMHVEKIDVIGAFQRVVETGEVIASMLA